MSVAWGWLCPLRAWAAFSSVSRHPLSWHRLNCFPGFWHQGEFQPGLVCPGWAGSCRAPPELGLLLAAAQTSAEFKVEVLSLLCPGETNKTNERTPKQVCGCFFPPVLAILSPFSRSCALRLPLYLLLLEVASDGFLFRFIALLRCPSPQLQPFCSRSVMVSAPPQLPSSLYYTL